jgi:hypothetical protein
MGELWSITPEGIEPDEGGAALEIQNEFHRRIQGLRRLSRQERAIAYRTAKKWYREALVALREKQSRDRQASWFTRRNRTRRVRFGPLSPSI